MKAVLPLTVLALALGACVPSAKAPAPAPVAVPPPAPLPAPAPAPVPQAPVQDSWMDTPATPGDWRYAVQGNRSEASFWSASGSPMLRLRCLPDNRTIALSLPDSGAQRPMVTIRAETGTRTLGASSTDREMTVAFAPGDPLLDAMALSKGRFAVESAGLPTLYLPSWAEVSRVIEDCR